jgi:molybdopterin molybdotransferase
MISVAEARALILANAAPCAPSTYRTARKLGPLLREDMIASRDQPPFRASAMDGYALRAIDTPGVLADDRRSRRRAGAGSPARRRRMRADFHGRAASGRRGFVLIQEDAARDGEIVTAPLVEKGRHVRSAGVDFKSGDRLLQAGAIIDAAAIALAAAAGRTSLLVSRRPRVAVLSGGDELVSPGQIARARSDLRFDERRDRGLGGAMGRRCHGHRAACRSRPWTLPMP